MRTELNILHDIIREKAGFEFVGFRSRRRAVTDLKYKFAYVARWSLDATWAEIARAMGWKEHTSAMVAERRVDGFLSVYPEWRRSVAEIQDELEFRMSVGMIVYKD
ncbi:MAG: hypothetical protein IKO81_07165 [Bacteroidales bacterium]|nr:hypothetical protein [Bacteroidales bacterium]